MSKQAMQRALDVLNEYGSAGVGNSTDWRIQLSALRMATLAIAELRAAVDAPEQMHVAGKWCTDLHCNKCYSAEFRFKHAPPDTEALRMELERVKGERDAAITGMVEISRAVRELFALRGGEVIPKTSYSFHTAI